jgi:hypothetical protein
MTHDISPALAGRLRDLVRLVKESIDTDGTVKSDRPQLKLAAIRMVADECEEEE